MKNTIFIVFFILILPTHGKVHYDWVPYSKTFGKSFGDIAGEGQASSVLPLADGGSIVAGYVWNPTQKAGNRALILRLDSSGQIVWEKYLGTSEVSYAALSVKGDLERGFFIGGETHSPGNFSSDFWALHLSAQGEILFEGSFGGEGEDTLRDTILTNQGDWYLVGSTIPTPLGSFPSHGWIVKINTKGKKIWSKTIGIGEGTELLCAAPTMDGSILVGGLSRKNFIRNQTQGYLARISSDGTMIWEKEYGSIYQDQIQSLVEDEGGAVIFGGVKEATAQFSGVGWLQKVDEDGHFLFERTFRFRALHSVQNLPGNGYIVAGITTGSLEDGKHSPKGWMAALNHDGRIQWEREMGGDQADGTYHAIPIDSRGFYSCGYTASFGLGAQKLWVMKLDPLGRASLEEIWSEDFQQAKSIGTIKSLESYIRSHPPSPHVGKVREMIYSLEEARLTLMDKNPKKESYEEFLTHRPESRHSKKVKLRIQELNHLEKSLLKDEISSYQAFIDQFPESHFAHDIEQRILNLRLKEAVRKDSLQDLEILLNSTQDHKFVEKCRKAIYQYYKKLDRIEGFEVFLSRYPKNPFSETARDRLHYLLYLQALEGDVEEKLQFLDRVRDIRYQKSLLTEIFSHVRRAKSMAGYLGFARRFPGTIIGRRALELVKSEIYDRAVGIGKILHLERYQDIFPHSQQFSEAQRLAYQLEERELLGKVGANPQKGVEFFEDIARRMKRLANLAVRRGEPWIAVRKWTLLRDMHPYSMTRQSLSLHTEAFFKFDLPTMDVETKIQLKAFDEGIEKIFQSVETHQRAFSELFALEKERKICEQHQAWLCQSEMYWLRRKEPPPEPNPLMSHKQAVTETKYEWPLNRLPEQPLEMPR